MAIGTYAETALHAALKRHYAGSGGEIEVRVGPYWIDVRRGSTLIEIQTANFSALRSKLARLLVEHDVLLVHPIAAEKQILWLDDEGDVLRRRKSPARGRVEEVFNHLVAFPELIDHPRLRIEVLLTREELLRRAVPRRKRFDRGWMPLDRRLLDIASTYAFAGPADFAALLPVLPSDQFSARDLANVARMAPRLAQRMTYCLRRMGMIEAVGKSGRAMLYTRRSIDFSIIHPSSPSA